MMAGKISKVDSLNFLHINCLPFCCLLSGPRVTSLAYPDCYLARLEVNWARQDTTVEYRRFDQRKIVDQSEGLSETSLGEAALAVKNGQETKYEAD